MRILITGGEGLIGGRLAIYLSKARHEIVLGSRTQKSVPIWLPETKVVRTDWNNEHELQKICNGIDVVIHAAGVNAHDCAANPVAALEFNGLATTRLVEAACKAEVNQFIFLSTAHIYRNPLHGSINEDTCPQNLHPYATSNLAGENAVQYATSLKLINATVLRLSNAFGWPTHKDVNCWSLLVNDLCLQAVKTGKMVIKSDVYQARDFITLADVCSVIGHLLKEKTNQLDETILNVGTGKSMSILEMAKLIQTRCNVVLGFEPQLKYEITKSTVQYERFEFCVNKLASMDIPLEGKSNAEIDELLVRCLNWFKSPI